jgi:murein DD-endopeptidase MepM/ murein hydrolase activator NlpD
MRLLLRPVSSSALLLPILTSALLIACGGEATPPVKAPPVTPQTYGGPAFGGPITYRLPVQGTWRVHRTHYGAKNDQAYALDMVVAGGPARPQANSEFPSYGMPIVADAPGVVVIAVDGVPDNLPGMTNRYDMHGNYVVIDHQNGEYSLMAHLIPGSLTVRPGQRVNAGSELGRCGNSGQSTMPHLHWQVMSHPHASVARGIVPRLLAYDRNGGMSTELPLQGDLLTPR